MEFGSNTLRKFRNSEFVIWKNCSTELGRIGWILLHLSRKLPWEFLRNFSANFENVLLRNSEDFHFWIWEHCSLEITGFFLRNPGEFFHRFQENFFRNFDYFFWEIWENSAEFLHRIRENSCKGLIKTRPPHQENFSMNLRRISQEIPKQYFTEI